jgi:hypothetical protein
MKVRSVLSWSFRFVLLVVLFYLFFIVGGLSVSGLLPNIKYEPGLVSPEIGLLVISIVNTLLVMGLVLSSRWNSWKLVMGLSFAYYGAVTFVMQIETWYFLSNITVGAKLLPWMFVMGMPTAFFFIPLAVWFLGKSREKINSPPNSRLGIPLRQWAWKLAVIALVYLVLYWSAGYFIAWQNPQLRDFYGSPGKALPFWSHLINNLHAAPWLFPFQILRAMIWTLCALPVIRGSKLNAWWTAIMVGLFFSIPQNIGHILGNPLIPIASIRYSHMIETASSTFIFGMIVSGLFHREHGPTLRIHGVLQHHT